MSDNVIQTSFSAGELSPNLNARVDFAKYRSGCATMRNFFVDYRSGASTRPGTQFIRPCPAGAPVRLVRFQQSTTVTYILEFGEGYIRFVSQGSSIVEEAFDIIGITNAGIATVDIGDTSGWFENDMIFISNAINMPQINNRYYYITNVSPNDFNLTDAYTGVVIDSTNYGVYAGGGLAQRVYTIGTPYLGSDLRLLKFSQNASIMNITHPSYPPYTLTLIDATNWVLAPVVFGATVGSSDSVTATPSAAGAVEYKYTVTAVDTNDQEGIAAVPSIILAATDLRVDPGSNVITWNFVAGATSYNVYASSASYVPLSADIGGVGFIGSTPGSINMFVDSNIGPDFTQVPPLHDNPFVFVNPAVSSYFQQRLVYANGGGDLVETFWCSRTGAPYNFDFSNPTQANDAITAELVSLEVNEIKSLIPMPTGLIALTTNGAWQINGGAGGVATQGGPITPATITATPQAYIGANDVPPIVVNYDILFIQAKGSIVRDMTFNIYANIYTGSDISILSSHLFYGHQIVEWAYAEEPFKAIWCIREDGVLLCLTLVKEQDMYGWSRHDTRGNFQSVASVTEGQLDATYVVVERPLGTFGRVKAIERIADRTFPFGAEDAWCVDCGLKTASFFPAGTLQVSASTGTVQLVVSSSLFLPSSVGAVIRVGGGIINLTDVQDEFVATGVVVQEITDIIPDDPEKRPRDAPSGTWSFDSAFQVIYGLDHLEGSEVSVLADGGVVRGLVVQNGSITLPNPVTKVIVGLGFQAQLQTMPLDLGNEINSVQGKRKKVGALTVRVKDSRAIKTGMTFETVTPIKELNRTTQMGLPIKLITADERIVMDPLWDVPGQICIQVDDPLPATVLGVIPEVVVGDSGGK